MLCRGLDHHPPLISSRRVHLKNAIEINWLFNYVRMGTEQLSWFPSADPLHRGNISIHLPKRLAP